METDWAVGEVLQALDRHGLAANTLVFFTSDNGHATYTGLPELQQHGHEPSGPWRGYKTDIWEGGHRIPFITRWPGRIKPQSVCDDTICLNNLLATCADILGATLPDDAGEDSFSIVGPLCGRTPDKPSHEAVVHHSGGGAFAIRRGPWKLIEQSGPGTAGQLYNLQTDPAEKENLYDKHPDIVAELGALLKQYKTSGRSRPVRSR